MDDMILVLNFDDVTSRSVARKLRAERVCCKIVSGSQSTAEIAASQAKGLILCGSATGEQHITLDAKLTELDIPVLALGDAAPALLGCLGGSVAQDVLERQVMTLTYSGSPLFEEITESERLLVNARPMLMTDNTTAIASTSAGVIGFQQKDKPVFGLQIQVEQNDPAGMQILLNFALIICRVSQWWDNDAFVERAVDEIRHVVGEGEALCALSGGVDSGVCALLGHMAIGKRMKCVFVDNGFLRKGEAAGVMRFFRDTMGLDVIHIDAGQKFLSALEGVINNDEKERLVYGLMTDILKEQADSMPEIRVLIQGTNYNDLMLGCAQGPFSRRLAMEHGALLEPVRELFKDEIRCLGNELGLSPVFSGQQSFPCGGLAVRIFGEVTAEKLRCVREADAIFREEVVAAGQDKRLWQYHAVYAENEAMDQAKIICLRAIHATGNIQAAAGRLPYDLLERTTQRILAAMPQINRVMYDLTPSSSYAGIEWQA